MTNFSDTQVRDVVIVIASVSGPQDGEGDLSYAVTEVLRLEIETDGDGTVRFVDAIGRLDEVIHGPAKPLSI